MAIDTKEKRFAFLGIGNHTIKHTIPGGSVDGEHRATLIDQYGGIPLDAPDGVASLLLINRSIANYGGMR